MGRHAQFADVVNNINGLTTYCSSNTQVVIRSGISSDSDNTYAMTNSGEITVNITVSGVNGLDTGSEAANTWYFIYLIKNLTTGTVAGLLSTSSTSPTMPSGYTLKRRIGAVRNNAASNFLWFDSLGGGSEKWIKFAQITFDSLVSGAAGNTAWQTVSASSWAPSTAVALDVTIGPNDTNSAVRLQISKTPGTAGVNGYRSKYLSSGISADDEIIIPCNASQQFDWKTDNVSGATVYLTANGYIDRL